MRLDGALAAAGLTRSQAKRAVKDGRVTADGAVARDPGMRADGMRILLDGAVIGAANTHTHVVLHKPAGVITAVSDARHPTVFSLLPDDFKPRGLCAVGRLDLDTTGLLLFTTDGTLAHRLISPKWTVEKSYIAQVDGRLTNEHVSRMLGGVPLKDFTAKPAIMTILDEHTARLVVTEGKYHQVKRMFGALGLPVTALHRERVGALWLDETLAPGAARLLTAQEIAGLYAVAGMEEA